MKSLFEDTAFDDDSNEEKEEEQDLKGKEEAEDLEEELDLEDGPVDMDADEPDGVLDNFNSKTRDSRVGVPKEVFKKIAQSYIQWLRDNKKKWPTTNIEFFESIKPFCKMTDSVPVSELFTVFEGLGIIKWRVVPQSTNLKEIADYELKIDIKNFSSFLEELGKSERDLTPNKILAQICEQLKEPKNKPPKTVAELQKLFENNRTIEFEVNPEDLFGEFRKLKILLVEGETQKDEEEYEGKEDEEELVVKPKVDRKAELKKRIAQKRQQKAQPTKKEGQKKGKKKGEKKEESKKEEPKKEVKKETKVVKISINKKKVETSTWTTFLYLFFLFLMISSGLIHYAF